MSGKDSSGSSSFSSSFHDVLYIYMGEHKMEEDPFENKLQPSRKSSFFLPAIERRDNFQVQPC